MKITEDMIDEKKLPEVYRELFDIVAPLTSDTAAKTVLLRFSELYSGDKAYFGKLDGLVIDERNERIRAARGKISANMLAKKYHITSNRVRAIWKMDSAQTKAE